MCQNPFLTPFSQLFEEKKNEKGWRLAFFVTFGQSLGWKTKRKNFYGHDYWFEIDNRRIYIQKERKVAQLMVKDTGNRPFCYGKL